MGITLKAPKLTKRGSFVAWGGLGAQCSHRLLVSTITQDPFAMIQPTMIQSLRGHLLLLCNLERSNLSQMTFMAS